MFPDDYAGSATYERAVSFIQSHLLGMVRGDKERMADPDYIRHALDESGHYRSLSASDIDQAFAQAQANVDATRAAQHYVADNIAGYYREIGQQPPNEVGVRVMYNFHTPGNVVKQGSIVVNVPSTWTEEQVIDFVREYLANQGQRVYAKSQFESIVDDPWIISFFGGGYGQGVDAVE